MSNNAWLLLRQSDFLGYTHPMGVEGVAVGTYVLASEPQSNASFQSTAALAVMQLWQS